MKKIGIVLFGVLCFFAGIGVGTLISGFKENKIIEFCNNCCDCDDEEEF